jgi:hypothetical protein
MDGLYPFAGSVTQDRCRSAASASMRTQGFRNDPSGVSADESEAGTSRISTS